MIWKGTLVAIVAVAAFWGGMSIADERRHTPRDAARAALRDTLGPLLAPPGKQARIHVRRCRQARGWHSCKARVSGRVTCRMTIRSKVQAGNDYKAWVPRMRCRR